MAPLAGAAPTWHHRLMSEPVVRMSSVVVNVSDLDRAKAFWTRLLGVDVSHEVAPFFA